MGTVRYSINVSLDGCVDHAAGAPNARTHQDAADWLAGADIALFGRVTFELMQVWRPDENGRLPDWVEPWMRPFAETIGAMRKVVVSSTPGDPGWNTEVVDGSDLPALVASLRAEAPRGIAVGGVQLARALAELGLIDEVQLVVHPHVVGHGPYLFEGLSRPVDLRLVDTRDLGDGVEARVFELVRHSEVV